MKSAPITQALRPCLLSACALVAVLCAGGALNAQGTGTPPVQAPPAAKEAPPAAAPVPEPKPAAHPEAATAAEKKDAESSPLDFLFGAGPTLEGDVDFNGNLAYRYGPGKAFTAGGGFYTVTTKFSEDIDPETFSSYEWTDRQYTIAIRPFGFDLKLGGDQWQWYFATAVENTTWLSKRKYYETSRCGTGDDEVDASCTPEEITAKALHYSRSMTDIFGTRADVLAGFSLRVGASKMELFGRYIPVIRRKLSGETIYNFDDGGGSFASDSLTFNGYGGQFTLDIRRIFNVVDLFAMADYTHYTEIEYSEGVLESNNRETRIHAKAGIGLPILALGVVYPMVSLNYSRIDRFVTPVGGGETQDSYPTVLSISLDFRNLSF